VIRGLGVALATVGLLSACASTTSTPAQELAWARWKQCDRFPAVRLNEIRADGAISTTVKTGAVAGLKEAAAWTRCMDEAAAAQQQRPAASRVPASAPVWHRGDAWTYRWAGPAGSGTSVWRVDREETIDGIDCYVTRSGAREMFFRKTDLASVRDSEDDSRYSPPRRDYVWPLAVGTAWEQALTEDHGRDRPARHPRWWSWVIEREERVTVPAGTFQTVKITRRNALDNAIVAESWYAPATRLPVRIVEHLPNGRRERELTNFRSAEPTAN
jgi:hypothetical protein